jgi:hypothetical protein
MVSYCLYMFFVSSFKYSARLPYCPLKTGDIIAYLVTDCGLAFGYHLHLVSGGEGGERVDIAEVVHSRPLETSRRQGAHVANL